MYKLLTVSFLCLAFTGLSAEQYVCSQPLLSMHKEPKELSEVVSQIIWSDSVRIIENGDKGWAKVATQDSHEGWVPYKSLTLFEDSTYPKPNKVAMVTSRAAHVYLVRDVKMYPPLLTLPYGAKLEVVSGFDVQAEKWAQVRLVNGEVAYIQRSDMVINPKPLSLDETLELAKSFIGIPYTWGGNSVYGFDSSGLAQMLYQQMDVQLPREASLQAEMPLMHKVSLAELEAGDFLFFSLADDGQIDHVGIYMGNNEFLHASAKNTPPSVQLTSLKAPYWQASLKKCCRLNRG